MRKLLYGFIAFAAVVLLAFMLLSERYVNAVRGRRLSQLAEEEREKSVRLEELKKELETLEKATKVKDVQATEELVAVSLDEQLYTELFPVMKEHKRVGVMALSPREFPGNEGKITKEQFTEMTKAGWTTCVVWDGVDPLDVFRTETEKKLKELGAAMPETIYVSVDEAILDFAEAAGKLSEESGAAETGTSGSETEAGRTESGETEAGTRADSETSALTESEARKRAEEEAGPVENYIHYDSVGSVESYLRRDDLIEVIGYDPYVQDATPVDAERMNAALQEQQRRAEERRQAARREAEEKGRADWRAAVAAIEERRAAADDEHRAAAAEAESAEAHAQEKLDDLKGAAERLQNVKDDTFADAGFRVVIGLSNEENEQELYRPLGKTWYPVALFWNDKGVKSLVDQVVKENGNIVLVVGFGGGPIGYRAEPFGRMLKAMDEYGDKLKFTGFADAIKIHDLSDAEIKAKQAYEKRKGELEPEIEELEQEIEKLYRSYYGK